jgi:hypothetical protein
MTTEKQMAIFEDQPARRVWDEKQEKWYFSVVDIIAVLTQSDRPRKYWNDLKRKLGEEGSQLSEKIGQLKMKERDTEMSQPFQFWGQFKMSAEGC